MIIQKNKRILVVTYSFSPGRLAESERAYYLVKALLNNGNTVSVLTAEGQDVFNFNNVDIFTLLPIKPIINQKIINRIINPTTDGLFFSFFFHRKRYFLSDFDIIISTSPPHSLHFVSYYLSKKNNTKFVMDLRDSWKDNSLAKYGTIFHKLISDYIYLKYLKSADLIIANTDALKNKIKSHCRDANIITIPNGYPKDSFEHLQPVEILSHEKIKILYSGGTYGGKAVDAIKKIINNSCEKNIKIGFLGERISETSNCIYLGKVNTEDVPSYLISADCLVLYLPPKELNSARILLKAYGYAKSGKPVIYIGPKNATYDFLKCYTTVFRMDEDDYDNFSKIINEIQKKTEKSTINSNDFSYEKNFTKLFQVEK